VILKIFKSEQIVNGFYITSLFKKKWNISMYWANQLKGDD